MALTDTPTLRRAAALFMSIALAATVILGLQASTAEARGKPDRTPVTIQFLNVSDWHAQLDPLDVFGVGLVGGAPALASYWEQDRTDNPNTLTLTAGDAYGASPPLSNFFDEVPAVQAMRLLGFDVDTFGNHNFDRGTDHLQQMIDVVNDDSGAHPGEPFRYVAANLRNRDAELDGVQDWHIFDVGGVKVGVVGLVNEEAPTLVFPGSFGDIEVTDSVRAANRAAAEMRRAGAQVLVAITHKGVRGFDESGNAFGELIDFADNVGGFDLIFGDHTDVQYSAVHGRALVTENRSKGLTYSRTLITVDPQNGRVVDRSVEFVTPFTNAVTPDPDLQALVDGYRAELAPIFGEEIGSSSVFIPRSDSCGRADGRLCESLVGNVVTDAMRLTYGADFALTNAGGLRAALTCPTTDNPDDFCPAYVPPPFPITLGQVFAVLPFGNQTVTLPVTGAELKAMLEHGVSAMPGANGRFAQVSGLCFTYDVGASVGSRVTTVVRQAADGSCTGPAVDLSASATYTLATNDFVASGGDGYPNLAARMVTRNLMANDLADHVAANAPISPAIEGRVVCTGAACPPVTAP